MTNGYEFPAFLEGTFDWRLHGLSFAEPPADNLLSAATLTHRDPWMVMATVLMYAQNGTFVGPKYIEDFFENHQIDGLSRAALLLCGDLLRPSEADCLVRALKSNNGTTRMHAAEAAAHAGYLHFVPIMLNAWERADGPHEHEIIGFAIADMLEDHGGDIADQAGIYKFDASLPRYANNPIFQKAKGALDVLATEEVDFPDLVMEQLEIAKNAMTDDWAVSWHGRPLSMSQFISDFERALEPHAAISLFDYRHRFEAYTGIDCSDFFAFGIPNELEIAAVIQDAKENFDIDGFEDGVRYFFGHPVRD